MFDVRNALGCLVSAMCCYVLFCFVFALSFTINRFCFVHSLVYPISDRYHARHGADCPMCPPALAIPKSPIFRLPLLQMKKFPDFKSRCKTCLSWHRMDWNLLERRIDWENMGRCFRCRKTPQKNRRHSCTDRLWQKFDCVRTPPRVIQ